MPVESRQRAGMLGGPRLGSGVSIAQLPTGPVWILFRIGVGVRRTTYTSRGGVGGRVLARTSCGGCLSQSLSFLVLR